MLSLTFYLRQSHDNLRSKIDNESNNAPNSGAGDNPTLTSSTNTRTDAALFKAHPTWGAVTSPNWPFNIASRVPGTNTVVVNGQLVITTLTNPALNPATAKGTDGMTVNDHEALHSGIYTKWWGTLSNSVSGVEGTYSSAAAADTAVAAANALSRLTFYNASLENNRLDYDHYGFGNTAEATRIISRMNDDWAARAAAQQQLNNLGQTWVNQGYYKGP